MEAENTEYAMQNTGFGESSHSPLVCGLAVMPAAVPGAIIAWTAVLPRYDVCYLLSVFCLLYSPSIMKIETRIIPVQTLGEPRHDSPLLSLLPAEAGMFSRESTRVIGDVVRREEADPQVELFERAGQRQRIYFDPRETRVGVVTCGGLCPGLNNVIRSLVLE